MNRRGSNSMFFGLTLDRDQASRFVRWAGWLLHSAGFHLVLQVQRQSARRDSEDPSQSEAGHPP